MGQSGVYAWALGWLLLAILIGIVLLFALAPCGINRLTGVALLDYCPAVAAPNPLLDELRRQEQLDQALRGQMRSLELALLQRPYCELPAAPSEPVEERPSAPDTAPGPQRAELAPCPRRRPVEVVLLLDGSTSMDWDYAADPAAEERYIALQQRYQANASRLPGAGQGGGLLDFFGQLATVMAEQARLEEQMNAAAGELDTPGADRIDVAKAALRELVSASPEDVDFTFATFAACGPARLHGRYASTERPQLLSAIDAVGLDDSTALADAIATLPQIARGGASEEEPINVVLLSDGRDSCGNDPCAAAAAVKRKLPHLYVNVVAISRSIGPVRCVAENTGGNFIEADEAERLGDMLVSAAGQDLPEHCR